MRNMIIEFSTENEEILKDVSAKFNSKDYQVSSYEMNHSYEDGRKMFHVSMVIKAKRMNEEGLLLMFLNDFPGVRVNKIV